ncbi:MAG: hypothetical protein VX554_00220, partial [Candidatus Thermoplasmatota archaeon]|nr:hypothetical protein [Candidatus Thermoplasmatota archaeon]
MDGECTYSGYDELFGGNFAGQVTVCDMANYGYGSDGSGGGDQAESTEEPATETAAEEVVAEEGADGEVEFIAAQTTEGMARFSGAAAPAAASGVVA